MHIFSDPAIQILSMHLGANLTNMSKEICTRMFIASLYMSWEKYWKTASDSSKEDKFIIYNVFI